MKNVELNLLLLGDLVFSNSCLSVISYSLIIIFYTADFGLTWLQTGFKIRTEIETATLNRALARRAGEWARRLLNQNSEFCFSSVRAPEVLLLASTTSVGDHGCIWHMQQAL